MAEQKGQENSSVGENSSTNTGQQETKVVQREIIYKWMAPMRHFKKLEKKRFFIILAGILGFFVILVILGQYWLMAALAAVMFLIYVVGTVPPARIEHVITTHGIETVDEKVDWTDVESYWFSKKDNQLILNVETKLRFPARLVMLVSEENMKKVHGILKERIMYKDLRKQGTLSRIVDGAWVDLIGVKK
ncbi:hypothetical protein JW710_04245 [Candidatus Dojkabacteria bacterium]|nr:hypothetical protein [Candidatus Dojkabacteria bacterium]